MTASEEPVSRGHTGRRSWLRSLFRLLNWVLLVLIMIPILALATCIGREVMVSRELESLCNGLDPGRPLATAMASGFEARFDRIPDAEEDWFDREYRRIHVQETQGVAGVDGLLVLFAKPGIGYYACIVRNRDGKVTSARYVDRSS